VTGEEGHKPVDQFIEEREALEHPEGGQENVGPLTLHLRHLLHLVNQSGRIVKEGTPLRIPVVVRFRVHEVIDVEFVPDIRGNADHLRDDLLLDFLFDFLGFAAPQELKQDAFHLTVKGGILIHDSKAAGCLRIEAHQGGVLVECG